MTTPNDPTTWLAEQTAQRPLTVLVFFRGDWCPFCQAYLKEMNGAFVEKVRAAGGELVAVTSQSESAADGAKEAWGLSYPVVSDPRNVLARARGAAITPKSETALADHPSEYPEGMAQPAVIALDGEGEVLFRWAIDPSEANLGGASDRPLPMDVWRVIEAALSGEERALEGEQVLDPSFLAAHYPEQHATFQAWVAQAQQS